MNSPGMEQNPSSLCQDGQGQPSLEVAGEGVLLDHVLTPQDKMLLSGWVWKPSAVMVTHSSRSSLPSLIQSWHSPPDFPGHWHRVNPAATCGLGWPLPQPSCCPHTSQGRGSLSNQHNSHQSSRSNWPLFSGREKSCDSYTYTHVTA